MEKTFLTLAIALASYSASAQINEFPPSGNVGIGTDHPQVNLHVISNVSAVLAIQDNSSVLRFIPSNSINYIQSGKSLSNSNADLRFTSMNGEFNWMAIQGSTGNVGIGATSPIGKLEVNDGNRTGVIAYFGANGNTGAKGLYFSRPVMNSNPVNIQGTLSGIGAADISLQVEGGNVGIGTSNPRGYKLAVNGTIHSKEIKVDLDGFPDYVFKPDYDLLSLIEVKNYIDKYHRLPEMPSEQEVSKEGISLGELNKLLVKKVEELTLYLLYQKEETDKQYKVQQQQINELKSIVSKLSK